MVGGMDAHMAESQELYLRIRVSTIKKNQEFNINLEKTKSNIYTHFLALKNALHNSFIPGCSNKFLDFYVPTAYYFWFWSVQL